MKTLILAMFICLAMQPDGPQQPKYQPDPFKANYHNPVPFDLQLGCYDLTTTTGRAVGMRGGNQAYEADFLVENMQGGWDKKSHYICLPEK